LGRAYKGRGAQSKVECIKPVSEVPV
jgi:hypothetical protein